MAASLTVFLAAALLVVPGSDGHETSVAGALLLLLACGAWAVDNNLTQTLTSKDPWQLVMVKTLGAGSCMVVLGLLLGGALPSLGTAGKALALGGLSYGVSVLLDAYALRLLGAARESAYFATAPFAGALLSMPILGEPLRSWQLSAALLMALGVALLLRERHSHDHSHPAVEHTHRHVHDSHHQHAHSPDVDPTEPHAHPHRHAPLDPQPSARVRPASPPPALSLIAVASGTPPRQTARRREQRLRGGPGPHAARPGGGGRPPGKPSRDAPGAEGRAAETAQSGEQGWVCCSARWASAPRW